MAYYDIMPFSGPHGGTNHIRTFALDAGETFGPGEPVRLTTAGTVAESPDNPSVANLVGIATSSGDTTAAAGVGNDRFARTSYPTTAADALPNTNDPVSVCIADVGQLFVTSNFTNGGVAFGDAAPALTDVGDEVGLTLIANVWGIDQSAGNNIARIVDVLDARGRSLWAPGAGAGTQVVFTFVQSQWIDATAPAAP